MKKVLLIFPGSSMENKRKNIIRYPYGTIILAGALESAGYEVRVVDTRIEGYQNIDFSQFLFTGIAVNYFGDNLKTGIEIAKYIKSKDSRHIVVAGGMFISSYKHLFNQYPFIDFIVVGEAEERIVTLANALYENTSKKDINIENIYNTLYSLEEYKNNLDYGLIQDLDNTPRPLYEKLNLDKYGAAYEIDFQFSRSCVCSCSFCYNTAIPNNRWRSKSAQNAVEELALLHEQIPFKKVNFLDDNLFVRPEKLIDIMEKLKQLNIELFWNGCSTINQIEKLSDEQLSYIKELGCHTIYFGGESGSPRVLQSINKHIDWEKALKVVERCKKYGILPVFSFIIGLPSETNEDIKATLNVYRRLKQRGAHISCINLYVPVYDTALSKGVDENLISMPSTLEEWLNFKKNIYYNKFDEENNQYIQNVSRYSRLDYYLDQYFEERYRLQKYLQVENTKFLKDLMHRILVMPARFLVFHVIGREYFRNKGLLKLIEQYTFYLHKIFTK